MSVRAWFVRSQSLRSLAARSLSRNRRLRAKLRNAQLGRDVIGAHRALTEAYETDVRPLLALLRTQSDLAPDPVEAFRSRGYAERLALERGEDAARNPPR